MFEWHFTIRGAFGTDFEGGIYHGRILLPPEYPFKPPHIMFLTPSGRFETNTKVCLSFSAYHPELWQPAWGIRLILEALISFLPTPADGAIGALDWSAAERKRLATKSVSWNCPLCGNCKDLLPKIKVTKEGGGSTKTPRFSKEIEELQRLQQLTEGNKTKQTNDNNEKEEEKDQGKNQGVDDDDEEEEMKKKENVKEIEPRIILDNEDEGNTKKSQNQPNDTEDLNLDPVPQMNNGNAVSSDVPPESTTQQVDQQQQQQQEAPQTEQQRQVAPAQGDESSDPSWMYDPLLNLMIVMLSAICYLSYHKFISLRDELALLREENM